LANSVVPTVGDPERSTNGPWSSVGIVRVTIGEAAVVTSALSTPFTDLAVSRTRSR
jgi:hypothetical protein